MVFINEWLPNPIGSDAAGEFVELYNAGPAAVDLGGWAIGTPKGKLASLGGRTVAARGYAILKNADLKFALVNTDGGLALYAPGGMLADSAAFYGTAPEGKSFSRADYASGPEAHFAWAVPTPGAPNQTAAAVVATSAPPYGIALNGRFTAADFFAIMMGTATFVTAIIFYIIKHHEDLSKHIFARNGKIRGGVREADGARDASTEEVFVERWR